MDRIVFAYSGSPTSSVAIPWLREHRDVDVVTVTVDLGQPESLDGIRVRAIGSGATRAHVLDRRDVFARHHLLPAVQTGAVDIDSDVALSALALPLIAHALVEIAQIEGTRVLAHAAMTPQDLDGIEAAVHAIAPEMKVVAVTREWDLTPAAMAEYARERGIPFLTPPASGDASMRPARSTALYVTIEFKAGVPVKINGVEMDLVELLTSLDTIAAAQRTTGSAALGAAYRALQTRAGSTANTGVERVCMRDGVCEVVSHVE